MNNLKISSKMHIFIAVSAVVIAIGLAMGLIFQFVAGGYFNFGAEYKSYNSVVVDYAYVDYSDGEEVLKICDAEFESAGVKYYNYVTGDTDQGGEITFKFSKSVDDKKIEAAVEKIGDKLNGQTGNMSNASFHVLETELGGGKTLVFASIALAAAAVAQFIYFAIRYKLTMACGAFLANVHNLAIYVSLLAITRIPVGSSAVVFGVIAVLATMIGCGLLFDRMRKNLKDEKFATLENDEQVDTCVKESFVNIVVISLFLVTTAVVLFVLMSISALSLELTLAPVVVAVLSVAASLYGTLFFTPSVYSRFKLLGDNFKAEQKKS